MATNTIRVGVIGASPDRGWARTAHIPALEALPDYRLTAVGTSRVETAREAARRFGAAHAFTDPRELAAHPEVDLVAVTVKVPHHAELIRAALDAGKHVVSEWPLALTTAEADLLAGAARKAGVHHAIVLQARLSPTLRQARELIAGGYLGRITSVNLYSALTSGAGGRFPAESAYTTDRANGAGLLEVAGGHNLDALQFLAGDITALSADLALRIPSYTVPETGETLTPTSPDQVLINATLTGGAPASIHLSKAKATNSRTRLEISGTEGDLAVLAGAHDPRGAQIQIGELELLGARLGDTSWQQLPVDARHRAVPADVPDLAVLNVAQLYADLAGDIHTNKHTTIDFTHAARLHHLLDTIRQSATTGTRHPVAS